MQVNSAYSQALHHSANAHRRNASENLEQSSNTHAPIKSGTAQKAHESTHQVFAKYDLTHISATDLDAMASGLRKSGFDDVGFILTLESQGANWRDHMQAALGDAGYDYDANYDPNIATDVIASTKEQLATATKFGEPTDILTEQLSKMESYNARAHPLTTTTPASQQMAETLVLFQAQRVWIE